MKQQHKAKIDTASWVSMLYYKLNWSQQKISDELSISRSSVSNLLSLAKEYGIVKIDLDIEKDKKIIYKQEFELREKYPRIKSAYIFQSISEDHTVRHLEKYAAVILQEEIQYSAVIGINFGDMVKRALLNMNTAAFKTGIEKYVVQIMGASNTIQPNDIVKVAAKKLSAEPVFLNCPFIVENAFLKKTLVKEPLVHNAMKFWKSIDTGIMGIGEISSEKLALYNFPENIREKIFSKEPAGELSGNFFNAAGEFISIIDDYIISITASDLIKINKKIIIASGENKVGALKAALKGGLIDILITDSLTIRKLLSGK